MSEGLKVRVSSRLRESAASRRPEYFTLADSPIVCLGTHTSLWNFALSGQDGSVPKPPCDPGTRAPADSLAATRRGCPNLLDGLSLRPLTNYHPNLGGLEGVECLMK
jgi:hypothetical protein